jgi:hypothetical protein
MCHVITTHWPVFAIWMYVLIFLSELYLIRTFVVEFCPLKCLYVETKMYFWAYKMLFMGRYLKCNVVSCRKLTGVGIVKYCVHITMFVLQFCVLYLWWVLSLCEVLLKLFLLVIWNVFSDCLKCSMQSCRLLMGNIVVTYCVVLVFVSNLLFLIVDCLHIV